MRLHLPYLSRNAFFSYLMPLLALFIYSTASNAAPSNSTIALVATINNQAVLAAAHWSIFKIDDPSTPLVTLPRHTGTISLPAGTYKAKVEMQNKTREQNFRVEAGVMSRVGISMD